MGFWGFGVYGKVKRVATQGNTETNLVMRMLYAKKMFELLSSGKRIINIDETWLPSMDYRSRGWCSRGQRNSVSMRDMSSRVNMIAALDTDGRLYLSLTQVNTDSDVMLMFLSRLALVLTKEDPEWRTNTVLVLDNAPYHRAKGVKEHLVKLGASVVLSGPYSYAAAPCETFFSLYKRGNQNPANAKTSHT